jgi:hypothetical protein
MLCLISTRFSFVNADIDSSQTNTKLTFVRSGVSWKYLLYGILGSALPILLPWFVAINSLAAHPEIAHTIMFVAMLTYIWIMPVIPSLGNIGKLNLLKTKLTAIYNPNKKELVDFSLDVSPMDGFWYERREDEKVLESIKKSTTRIFKEQLDLDSFQI